MSAHEERVLQSRLSAARIAIVVLLGALGKVRDLITGGYFKEAKSYAEAALIDADDYLKLVDEPNNDNGGAA